MISDEYSGSNPHAVIVGIAIVISLLFHFILGFVVANRKMVVVNTNMPEREDLTFQISDVEPQLMSVENELKMMAESDKSGMEQLPPGIPETVFDPPPVPDGYGLPSASESSSGAMAPSTGSAELFIPRVEMLASESVTAPELENQRFVIPDADRKDNAPDIVPEAFSLKPSGGDTFAENVAFVPAALPSGIYEADKLDSMFVQSDPVSAALAPEEMSDRENPLNMAVENPEDKVVPIEYVLDAALTVYRPPVSDGYKYFKIDIHRKSEEVLKVIPRDVLFVIDTSGSVSWWRMGVVKKSIRQGVDALSPNDRFNILAFSTENRFCFGSAWQSLNNASKAAADDFLDTLESGGSTDIYGAMKCALDLPRDPARVMLVFLISDGRATAGIQKASEIISEFSVMNSGRVSVFATALGSRDNEYLLSMLSILNRGDLASIPKDKFRITPELISIVEKTSRPVLSDISFTFDIDSAADIAPAMTTHLYLDRPLSVFGRVKEDVGRVVFQAKGVSGKTRYDMVFSLNLDSPEAKKGTPLVATDWAKARMYDFFAKFDETRDQRIMGEMLDLRNRYGVMIPFVKAFMD